MKIILPIIIIVMFVGVIAVILWTRCTSRNKSAGISSGQRDGNSARQQFVTEQAFRRNIMKQVTMSPQTLAQLRKYGVTANSKLRLEFFFYTDTEAKAQSLAASLHKLGYELETKQTAGDQKLLLVNGWTTPLQMDDHTVLGWTRQMCQMGYEHDCDFDGWGTNPN